MTTPITQILNPNVPIMNKDGTPTSLFQRMWANIKAVNKSGDTMTGSLTINPGSLTVTNTGTAGSLILNNTGATNGLVTFNQKNSGYNCDMTFTNTNVPSVSNVISCRNTGDFWIFLNTATNLDLCTNAALRFRIDGAGNLKGGASALTLIDSNRIFYLPQYTTAGLPAAGTAGRLLYDTTVGAVKYDTGSAWTALGSGSGGGKTSLGSTEGHLTGSITPSVNYYLMKLVMADANFTINKIAFAAPTAVSTVKFQPFVYSSNAAATATVALLGSGPQVTGSVAGYNEAPLTSSVSVTKGQLIWIGLCVTTTAINIFGQDGGYFAFAANGGSTVPSNPAPALTTANTANQVYGFWAV